MDALERVFEKAPPAALARALGIKVQAITGWKQTRRVPAERVLAVSQISGVPPHEIRPDIYPAPPKRKGRAA